MPQVIIPIYNTDEHDTDRNFGLVELDDQLIELIIRRHQTFCQAQSNDPDIQEIRYWDSSVTYFGYFERLEDGSLMDSAENPIIDIEDRLAANEIIVLHTRIDVLESYTGKTDAQQMSIRKEGVYWSACTPRAAYIDTAIVSIDFIKSLRGLDKRE